MKAWREFFDECRLAFAEWLMWTAVEVLPNGAAKLEAGTFLLEYAKRRAQEMQAEQYQSELRKRRL